MIGVHYVDQHVATGFGIHLAQPIFRSEWKEGMTLEEGVKLLEKALLVLFYRDRSAINKIQACPPGHSQVERNMNLLHIHFLTTYLWFLSSI